MATPELYIRSAYLKTNEKLSDRFLFCGKISKSPDSRAFFFYLIEILSPWFPSSKVKTTILSVLEKEIIPTSNDKHEKFFEDVVLKVNEALSKLPQEGEKDWVGNLNAVIGLMNNGTIIITQTGNVSGYIFRKGKISTITEKTLATSHLVTFEEVTSGTITNNDHILFANTELHNHLSIDNLRSICDQKPAKITLVELFRALRRIKVTNINAVILEASQEEAETEISKDLSEELFVDEPEETLLSITKKRLSPIISSYSKTAKHVTKKAANQSKILLQKSKEHWDKTYGPKAKELLKKGNSHVASRIAKLQPKSTPDRKDQGLETGKESKGTKVNTILYTKEIKTSPIIKKTLPLLLTYLKKLFLPENRKYLYGICIVLLVVIGYSKIRANNADRSKKIQEQKIVDALGEAERAYTQAKEDLALGKPDGIQGLNLALTEALNAKNNKSNEAKAEELRLQIQKDLDTATKTTRLANPTPFLTMGNNVNRMIMVGSEIYGISTEGKIYAADIRDKEPQLVASIGKDNGDPISLAASKNLDKILIYTSKHKILSYDIASKTFGELKITDDTGKWEDAKSMVNFSTNIYLLDSEAGQIWKHVQRTGGYSKGTSYADSSQLSIRGAVDLTIDGELYVLQNDGTVAKFSKGSYDNTFSIKSPPLPNDKIEIPSQISTDPDSNDFFILDKKLNRIIKFTKTGDFVSQYTFDNLAIDRFDVNTKIQKMWVYAEGKVFDIGL